MQAGPLCSIRARGGLHHWALSNTWGFRPGWCDGNSCAVAISGKKRGVRQCFALVTVPSPPAPAASFDYAPQHIIGRSLPTTRSPAPPARTRSRRQRLSSGEPFAIVGGTPLLRRLCRQNGSAAGTTRGGRAARQPVPLHPAQNPLPLAAGIFVARTRNPGFVAQRTAEGAERSARSPAAVMRD